MSDTPTAHEGRTPSTRREPAVHATRRDTPGGGREDAPTRREGIGEPRRTRRLNLPTAVADHYDYLHDLPTAGGEADIALLRSRVTQEDVIFKSYRAGLAPDPVAMDILRTADTRHIVRLIDLNDGDDGVWEIQEYCSLGSLRDWVGARGGRLPKDLLSAVVSEIAAALKYLHDLSTGVAHRDLKPANVLVRSEDPVDLVLTDFGLAKAHQAFTHLTTTVKGTWHYAAPEVHSKQSSPKSDWFSLGAMVFEFYTGRKLFALADGTDVSEDDARARSVSRNYSTDLIDDPRWKLLADGLLTWDKDFRWGAEQVEAWLRGESPRVVEAASAQSALMLSVRYRVPWGSTLVGTPAELAEQFRTHWDDSAAVLAGRTDEKLLRFLDGFPGMDAAVRIVKSTDRPATKLVQLQGILDPTSPVHFAGVSLDDASLVERISAAEGGDANASDWLVSLVSERVLLAYAEVAGSQRAADADYLLHQWEAEALQVAQELSDVFDGPFDRRLRARQQLASKRAEALEIQSRLANLATEKGARSAFRDVLPELVAHSLRQDRAAHPSWLAEAARKVAATGSADDWPWSAQLARTVQSSPDIQLGLMTVARIALGLTSQWEDIRKEEDEAERLRREEAERQREEANRLRREESARRREEERALKEEESRRAEEELARKKAEADRWWDRAFEQALPRYQEAARETAKRTIDTAKQQLDRLPAEKEKALRAAFAEAYYAKGRSKKNVEPNGFVGGWSIAGLVGLVGANIVLANAFSDFYGSFWILILGATGWAGLYCLGGAMDYLTASSNRRKVTEPVDLEFAQKATDLRTIIATTRARAVTLVKIPRGGLYGVIGTDGKNMKSIEHSTGARIEVQSWMAKSRANSSSGYASSRYRPAYYISEERFDGAPAYGGLEVVVISADTGTNLEAAASAVRKLVNAVRPAKAESTDRGSATGSAKTGSANRNPRPMTPSAVAAPATKQVAINDIGSAEDFLAAIEKTLKFFNDGDIIEGTIVKIDRDEVLLDVGYKTHGVIPSRELSIKHDVDPNEVVNVGDHVEALVLQKEDKEGRLILSKKRAQYERAWGDVEKIKENDGVVTGSVIEVVKGGLIVDIGLRGFLPASLIELHPVPVLSSYLGQEIEARILELDKNRYNVVLSRRAVLEQREQLRPAVPPSSAVDPTAVRRGTIRWFNTEKGFGFIAPAGGGDDVFVHVSSVESASTVTLAEGQAVEYKIGIGKKGPQAQSVRLV